MEKRAKKVGGVLLDTNKYVKTRIP